MSSTSGSRSSSPEPHSAHASGGGQAQVQVPVVGHVQIGIWCPHQSWRETHQSGACSSDSIANRCWLSGWKRTRRSRSASIAGPRELVHPAPPLGRDERLDARVAALARPDRVAVVLALLELAALLEPREDPRRRPPPASGPRSPRRCIRPSGPITVSVGEPVVAADLEVHRVVAGRDLERARAERRARRARRRSRARAARRPGRRPRGRPRRVALVVRVHRDGDVGEDRRGPHGRDRDPRPSPSANG